MSRRGSCRTGAALVVLVLGGAAGGWARAQVAPAATPTPTPVSPFTVRTSVTEAADYESNPLLTPQGAKPIYGSISTPQVEVLASTPTQSFDLTALMNANEFNLTHYSSEDGHAVLAYSNTGAIWTEKLGATFDYDTTRSSEETTSGIEVAGIRHAAATLSPEIDYLITPRDRLSVQGSYGATRYSDTQIYTNYIQAAVAPSYTRVLNETDQLSFGLLARRFETRSGPSVQFTDEGATLEWQGQFDPRWTFDGTVGGVHRSSRYAAINSVQIGGATVSCGANASVQVDGSTVTCVGSQIAGATVWEVTYGLSAIYKGQTDGAIFSVSSTPTPLSVRTEAEVTKFSVTGSHQLTPHWELDLSLSYQFSDYGATEGPNAYLQKYYLSASPKIQYHLTESLSLALSGSYRRQQGESLGDGFSTSYDPAEAATVQFTISYSPNPRDL
jgi:hypothetical protein